MIEKTEIEYINDAIHALAPGCSFSVIGHSLEADEDGGIECIRWHENNTTPEPKRKDVLAKIQELKAQWVATSYQRLRAPQYPPIGEQLDALFKAGVFPEDMAARIQAVKDKYPKT